MGKQAKAGRPEAQRQARQQAKQKIQRQAQKGKLNPPQEANEQRQLQQLRARVLQLQTQLEVLRAKKKNERVNNNRASEARLLRWRIELPENAPAELAVNVVYTPKTGSPTRLELTPDITDVQQKTGRERIGTWTATLSDNVRYKLDHDSGRVVLFGKTMPVAVAIKVLPNPTT